MRREVGVGVIAAAVVGFTTWARLDWPCTGEETACFADSLERVLGDAENGINPPLLRLVLLLAGGYAVEVGRWLSWVAMCGVAGLLASWAERRAWGLGWAVLALLCVDDAFLEHATVCRAYAPALLALTWTWTRWLDGHRGRTAALVPWLHYAAGVALVAAGAVLWVVEPSRRPALRDAARWTALTGLPLLLFLQHGAPPADGWATGALGMNLQVAGVWQGDVLPGVGLVLAVMMLSPLVRRPDAAAAGAISVFLALAALSFGVRLRPPAWLLWIPFWIIAWAAAVGAQTGPRRALAMAAALLTAVLAPAPVADGQRRVDLTAAAALVAPGEVVGVDTAGLLVQWAVAGGHPVVLSTEPVWCAPVGAGRACVRPGRGGRWLQVAVSTSHPVPVPEGCVSEHEGPGWRLARCGAD